ncbi:MAG TPA: hypothetical protein DIU18_01725 [Gemmatimonadetes bacterium]|nr:hypothetical protein [Gemmatimonadota bacterium]|tara:strand:- start:4705 stop:5526 length:822 start_codon:yes stop_codon:yes gene_type:complete
MRSCTLPFFGLALLWITLARPVWAQDSLPAFDGLPPVPTRPDLSLVDSLYVALDARGSLEAAEEIAGADSTDEEAIWRASRAALALGLLATEESVQMEWYRRSAAHAARVVALDSLRVEGLYLLAAAEGRRALQESPRVIPQLAQEVWVLAQRVLALEPGHPGAHNILGKVNFEVMTLGRVKGFIARLLTGDNTALDSASWVEAERHQLASVKGAPFMILFRYELAQTYLRLGRRAEAELQLRELLALPVRHPPDAVWREDAQRLLVRLEESP